jgi:hypothetical protein
MSVIVREPDGQNRLLVKVIWCFINRLTFIRNENSNNLFEAYIIDTHEAGHLNMYSSWNLESYLVLRYMH